MSRLCIIPARGGSKRIPRKNIKLFLGKPIIAYSIEAALSSKLFDRVVVSTDDEEIADVARDYKAEIPFMRSAENANDYATTVDVLREVLASLPDRYDEVCCIYATAPFVSGALLRSSYEVFEENKFDSLFPVLAFDSPIQRALYRTGDGRVAMFHPEHMATRSQDLEPAYHDAGMFYWLNPVPVLSTGRLWTENSGPYLLSAMDAQDIDVPTDWQLAELKYQLKYGS